MKTKKISWQAIAIVVLALVLIASIALGVSGAWFQDQDSATANATMGEAVTIKLTDKATDGKPVIWSDKYTGEAFPGDIILGSTKIKTGSDSGMVLRYKVSTIVKDGETEVTEEYINSYTEANMPTYYKGDIAAFKAAAKQSLTLLTTEINAGIVAGDETHVWETTLSGDGYYYYSKVSEAVQDVTLFAKGISIPKGVTNEAAQWTIEISVTVEAMQAANITDTENPWADDLTTAISEDVTRYLGTRNK